MSNSENVRVPPVSTPAFAVQKIENQKVDSGSTHVSPPQVPQPKEPKQYRASIAITLPLNTLRSVDARVKAEYFSSRSNLITTAVEYFLDQLAWEEEQAKLSSELNLPPSS